MRFCQAQFGEHLIVAQLSPSFWTSFGQAELPEPPAVRHSYGVIPTEGAPNGSNICSLGSAHLRDFASGMCSGHARRKYSMHLGYRSSSVVHQRRLQNNNRRRDGKCLELLDGTPLKPIVAFQGSEHFACAPGRVPDGLQQQAEIQGVATKLKILFRSIPTSPNTTRHNFEEAKSTKRCRCPGRTRSMAVACKWTEII